MLGAVDGVVGSMLGDETASAEETAALPGARVCLLREGGGEGVRERTRVCGTEICFWYLHKHIHITHV